MQILRSVYVQNTTIIILIYTKSKSNEVEYFHVKDYEMPVLKDSNPANDYGHYKGSAANHHYIIENVIDTLKHRTSATTNALEGMKVVDIIERIYQVKTKNDQRS